uniref:Phytocyanin domain-containing protein n=1 Tax=Aegilops tauschii subsp. strangulata TaxID=200361 RepID=A0A453MI37_AEGTS
MAAQGRGSANVAVVLGVLLLCTLVAEAAVFNVGDRGGWSFNTNSWPAGKRFKAGDVLGIHPSLQVHGCMMHRFITILHAN